VVLRFAVFIELLLHFHVAISDEGLGGTWCGQIDAVCGVLFRNAL
jgi:hypothetical protein